MVQTDYLIPRYFGEHFSRNSLFTNLLEKEFDDLSYASDEQRKDAYIHPYLTTLAKQVSVDLVARFRAATDDVAAYSKSALPQPLKHDVEKIVLFHIREPSYRGARQRDAAPSAFSTLVQELEKEHFSTVRMGDHTMSPMATAPFTWDYSKKPIKTDFEQLQLLSKAAYIVGNVSGVTPLSVLFSTPLLLTNVNHVSSALLVPKISLVLFKKVFLTTGRRLSPEEFCSGTYHDNTYLLTDTPLDENGTMISRIGDNDANEILLAFADLRSMVENNTSYKALLEACDIEYEYVSWLSKRCLGTDVTIPICPSFLKQWLEETQR